MSARILLGLVLTSCAVAIPIPSTAGPAGVAPADATAAAAAARPRVIFGRLVDPRDLTVTLVTFSTQGAEVAAQLTSALPGAWETATGGRSRVTVIDGDADIHILVLQMHGDSTGGGRGITLRFAGTTVGPRQVGVLIHELGHALGCCYDEHSDGKGHWGVCDTLHDVMCAGGPRISVVFSERELRAIRVLD